MPRSRGVASAESDRPYHQRRVGGLRSCPVPTKRRAVPPDPEIGRRLARALSFHGVTASDLARRVGLSQPAISQIVTGVVTPRDETARRIGEALGEDWEWLMGRKLTGSKGLGALLGGLYDRLGDDRLRYLGGLSEDELRDLIDRHRTRPAVAPSPRRRPRPRKP
jgi:transcriptional regulator with XRE-family HTH domain